MNILPGKLLNLTILIVSVFLLFIRIPYEGTGTALDLSGMTLTLFDDFEGDTLNPKVWSNFTGGPRKGGYWSRDQIFLEDGTLRLRTEYKDDGEFGPGYYSMGIRTKDVFEQQYGYFECRCILPAAQGLWSAFWLMSPGAGEVTGTGENGTEIDIFESPYYHLGSRSRNKITSNLHYNGYDEHTRYQNVGIFAVDGDPYSQYNTYGLLWTEDEYVFYINGKETGRSSFGGVAKVPEYLKLSVEVDGADTVPTLGWSGRIDWNNPERLPADFIVDYVKVYQFNEHLNS
jgi:beta-glucanase (GH16 family)